jgi:hypothetical protein
MSANKKLCGISQRADIRGCAALNPIQSEFKGNQKGLEFMNPKKRYNGIWARSGRNAKKVIIKISFLVFLGEEANNLPIKA